MAVPFDGTVFTFTQPDGTTIQVRGWGNNRDAIFETLDGYTVMRDPHTGYYVFANLTADGSALRSTGVPASAADGARLGIPARLRPTAIGTRSALPHTPHHGRSRWEIRRDEMKRSLATNRAAGVI